MSVFSENKAAKTLSQPWETLDSGIFSPLLQRSIACGGSCLAVIISHLGDFLEISSVGSGHRGPVCNTWCLGEGGFDSSEFCSSC